MQTSQNSQPSSLTAAASREAARAEGRERFASFRKEQAPPAAEPAAEPDPAAVAAPTDGAAPDPAESPPPETDPAAPSADGDPGEALDPAAAKRLALAQKEEQRRKSERAAIAQEREKARAEIEAERKRFEAERTALEAERKMLEEYRTIRDRARLDPGGVLESLGLSPEEMEIAARDAWSRSPAGAKDPKAREEAARLARERAAAARVDKTGGEVAALKQQLDEMKKLIEQGSQSQSDQQRAADFVESVEDAVTDEHPVLSRAISQARARAEDRTLSLADRREAKATHRAIRDEFLNVALDLYRAEGVEPDPAEVAAEVERRRVAELRRWGVPLTPEAPKKKPPGAPPPRMLTPAGSAPSSPSATKLTPEQSREKFIRDREAGKLDL